MDYLDEKPNNEIVNDSVDEEKNIQPEQTNDEIERESLNKEQTIEQDYEEQPMARFESFFFKQKNLKNYFFILDHVVYLN
jgi:hypothetical protein